ncbi:phospholipase A2 group XV-like [Toxorhynchites rutilus septentrionalis]|uniref:phospholipase A2 group XV-like n=1 Tax=Toxorhynchites rutilus septentrionalis TaxID=329112 RepID=UPI0024783963|nr:phospholipase A2 group XV-like [Toxorhynchites rutilus septentrionalis]
MRYVFVFLLFMLFYSVHGTLFGQGLKFIKDLKSKLGRNRDSTYERKISPVIFVPGDGGSQMDAIINKPDTVHFYCQKTTSTYFNLWLNKELLVPFVIDCWIDNIRLVYNNVTRKTQNAPGVETRIPGFGSSETVEWIDPSHASVGAYFVNIANSLVLNGYKRDVSIRGAPYDFRKAPNENKDWFIKVKHLVEETYTLNGDVPITFIVHSMGAPMTLLFLQMQSQQWKDKHIRRVISLAGAWGGSVKAIKCYAIGDDLGAFALSGKVLRTEQITNPSLAWLMPNPLLWKPNEVMVQTLSRSYTLEQMEDFFKDINFMDGWEMRKDTIPYSLNFTAPGVELHCLYGVGTPTVEMLNYEKSYDLTGKPTLVNGDGDGTVNKRSLEACKHWSAKQKQPIFVQEFQGTDHMAILANLNVLDSIVKVLVHD